MKRIVIAAVAGAVALSAAACGLDHGTVTGKTHVSGYYYTEQMCTSYSSSGMCRFYMPYQEWQPDCWKIDLRSGSDTGSQCVDESTYDRLRVGDNFGG